MPFNVTMLLADSAQAVSGKLYILGGGWSIIGPEPQPSAVALYIKVPWDQTNREHKMLLELVDFDGDPVLVETDDATTAIRFEHRFNVGRPAHVKPGTPLDVALALNFGPIVLEPGKQYAWRLSINGETHEHWSHGFSVRPRR